MGRKCRSFTGLQIADGRIHPRFQCSYGNIHPNDKNDPIGRNSYKPYSSSQRASHKSRSRRTRDDADAAPTLAPNAIATSSTSTPTTTSGRSRGSKRQHRSSGSSAGAPASAADPAIMGGTVSSKLPPSLSHKFSFCCFSYIPTTCRCTWLGWHPLVHRPAVGPRARSA